MSLARSAAPALAVSLFLATSCGRDTSTPTGLQRFEGGVASITGTIDGESYTVEAATQRLHFSSGTWAQLTVTSASHLATALQDANEGVTEQIEDMTEWATQAQEECEPTDYSCLDQRRVGSSVQIRRGKAAKPNPNREISARPLEDAAQPAFSFASVSGDQGAARHTSGTCLDARHRKSSRRSDVRSVSLAAALPSPCQGVALTLYEQNNRYRDLTFLVSNTMKILQLSTELLRDCITEDCRLYYTQMGHTYSQHLTHYLELLNEARKERDAAGTRYRSMDCFNSSSANWLDSFALSLGSGGGGGGGSSFTRTCSSEYWEISFDGGATWEGFTAETCYVSLNVT
jgi:hypothetical protein